MRTRRNHVLGAGLAIILALSGLAASPAAASGPVEAARSSSTDLMRIGVQPMYMHNGFSYAVHIQNIGWRWDIPGTTGRDLGIEAIVLTVPTGADVCLTAWVQGIGWQRTRCTGKNGGAIQVGTVGQNRRIESLIFSSSTHRVQAQAHVATWGWEKVKTAQRNFANQVGIPGYGRAIEMIYFTLG